MATQHREADALIAELMPHWSTLAQRPDALPSLAPALAVGERLSRELLAHLVLEETVLFPALRAAVPADQLLALGQAMRKRRGAR
jgi:hypothetical protein